MASQVSSFSYDHNQLVSLELCISSERLSPYFKLAFGNRKAAIQLYERNTYLSEALYGVTQAAEVCLRNAIHGSLSLARDSTWFDVLPLTEVQNDMLAKAKDEIEKRRYMLTPGRIVAELGLGFWISLISATSEKTIWVPYLHKVFLNAYDISQDQHGRSMKRKLDRDAIYSVLDRLRYLRNRIAHHESILKLDLNKRYLEVVRVIEWICPTSAEWVRRSNCFPERFARVVNIPPPMRSAEPPRPIPGKPPKA